MFDHALLRTPGADAARGLTTADMGAPDPARTAEQFAAYTEALQAQGLSTTILPPLPGFPDAHFVEDTAVVLPEVAVITRPGAPERDGEQQSVAEALADWRPLARVEAPGTLDGGDVLRVGDHFLIGLSARTNEAGAAQLGSVVAAHGCSWETVPVAGGLHLKSGVNAVAPDRVLAVAELAALPAVARFAPLIVPPDETYAANCLWLGAVTLVPDGFPRTRGLLEQAGIATVAVDTSEFRRMDGGLTCLSLRF